MISTLPSSTAQKSNSTTISSRTQRLWVLGIVLVLGGQIVLLKIQGGDPLEGTKQWIAGGLLILGAALFGWLVKPVSSSPARLDFPADGTSPSTFVWRETWILSSFFASIVFAALAIFLFVEIGENTIVVLLWLTSILSLFIASLGNVRVARPRLSQDRIYPLALAGLLGIAAWTRLYKLTTLPYNFDGDFASVGLEARALLTGHYKHIFAFGWADIPILGYFPPYLTMKLFGDNLFGLNVSGVIEGLLVILGVYLLGRDLFHPRVGLLAAALLTISYAHLAASRQATYIDPVFFLVYILYFLLLGLREDRGWAIVVSGVLTALCMQVYFSGRVIVFLLAFLLLFGWIFHRAWLKTHTWALMLWGMAFVIGLGPMLVVFVQNSNAFFSRTREVFILAPEVVRHEEGVYQVNTIPAMLLQQARRTVWMFHYYHDTGTQFGFLKPFLDPFTAILFTLGLGYASFHPRKIGNALMLAWILIGLILGSFLTANPPFWARMMILLPPTGLLSALALDLIYQKLRDGIYAFEPKAAVFAPILTLLVLSMVGFINWQTYVSVKGHFATARTYIGRYLAEQPASTHAYLVSNDFRFNDREFDFLAPGRLLGSIPPDQLAGNLPLPDGSKMLILTAEQQPVVLMLQQLYPNVSFEPHPGNSPGEVAFYVVRMP